MEKKLVEHLVKSGVVSQALIQRCRLKASMRKNTVIDELASEEEVDQGALVGAMAEYWGLGYLAESRILAEEEALSLLSFEEAQAAGALPVEAALEEGVVTLAVYDVEKAKSAVEKLRRMMGVAPTLLIAPRDQVLAEIDRHYRERVEMEIRRRYRLDEEEQEAPTRQVDLARDNPFFDLIEESGRKTSKIEEATLEEGPREEGDFFGEFSRREERRSRSQVTTRRTTISAALEAFDEELATKELDPVEEPILGDAGDWGEGGDEAIPYYDAPASGRSISGAGEFAKGFEVSGSTIFSVDRQLGRPLEFDSAGEEDLEALLSLVNEQRRLIQRLERQVEHQKGILQTFAELLIERQVLDRQELKVRLKALKQEQKRRR